MAKTSDIAKSIVIDKLKELFPNNALVDKKLYINLSVEGEEVQLSIALTAPKTKLDLSSDNEISTKVNSPSTINTEQIKKEANEIFDFFNL